MRLRALGLAVEFSRLHCFPLEKTWRSKEKYFCIQQSKGLEAVELQKVCER